MGDRLQAELASAQQELAISKVVVGATCDSCVEVVCFFRGLKEAWQGTLSAREGECKRLQAALADSAESDS